MVSKTYCDCCNNEVHDRTTMAYVKIENVHFGRTKPFSSLEICPTCRDEIITFIKQIGRKIK